MPADVGAGDGIAEQTVQVHVNYQAAGGVRDHTALSTAATIHVSPMKTARRRVLLVGDVLAVGLTAPLKTLAHRAGVDSTGLPAFRPDRP